MGEIIDYELNSPFVYLRSLVEGLSTPGNGEGGSEQIREGASISLKPPTDPVERFLVMLRLESMGEVDALAILKIQQWAKLVLSGSNLFPNRNAQ